MTLVENLSRSDFCNFFTNSGLPKAIESGGEVSGVAGIIGAGGIGTDGYS